MISMPEHQEQCVTCICAAERRHLTEPNNLSKNNICTTDMNQNMYFLRCDT